MRKYLVLIPALTLLLQACSNADSSGEAKAQGNSNKPTEYKASDKDLSIDEYMAKVDDETTPKLIKRSLDFNNDEYLSIYVESWSDSLDTEDMKITEVFVKNSTSSQQEISFYRRDEKVVATRELVESKEVGKIFFVERITYYDENEEPTSAKYRKAEFQDDLDTTTFMSTEAKKVDMQRAIDVMNSQGAFTSKFVQFFDPGGELWIIVGNPEEGGFRSALLLNDLDGDLQTMFQNPELYVGKPLALSFQIMREYGTTYQLLLGASLR